MPRSVELALTLFFFLAEVELGYELGQSLEYDLEIESVCEPFDL
jgi:hypothetical protein